MCIPHGKNIDKPLSTKLFKVVDDLLHVYFQRRQKELCLQAVLRIRIHLINVFCDLQDPDPDPVVRGMDPDPALDPDPSNFMQK
jgi:hypothetical protein